MKKRKKLRLQTKILQVIRFMAEITGIGCILAIAFANSMTITQFKAATCILLAMYLIVDIVSDAIETRREQKMTHGGSVQRVKVN